MVKIATMETPFENTAGLTVIWNLLNECIENVSLKPGYKFNPIGWMADELGSNWKSIENVFGKEALKRVTSCKLHYLKNRNIHRNKIPLNNDQEVFTRLTDKMLCSKTVSEFMRYYEELLQFINECPVRKECLTNFVTWWHARKTHVFDAFRQPLAPATNLAEVLHSSWSNTNLNNLSLLDCCIYGCS